eukprot:647535-Prorocentrum_minimum.AAC.1
MQSGSHSAKEHFRTGLHDEDALCGVIGMYLIHHNHQVCQPEDDDDGSKGHQQAKQPSNLPRPFLHLVSKDPIN